jgi:hypothetical protein
MNQAMLIKQDKDVLGDLYTLNTSKKRQMMSYENNQNNLGPNLNPMLPNWDELDGKWNDQLFKLFVVRCRDDGDADKLTTDEDEYDIHEMFMDRLQRLRNLIKRNGPKDNESTVAAGERLKVRKKQELKRQRHHSRRGEVSGNQVAPGYKLTETSYSTGGSR